MSKQFDMKLFLAGVLTGSQATQQRHVRQANIIQAEIAERRQRETPWAWQRKHLVWFLEQRLKERSGASQYNYLLTVRLRARRLKSYGFSISESVLILVVSTNSNRPVTLLKKRKKIHYGWCCFEFPNNSN
ncbi:hypothetical protein [Pseudomonas fluorescens]|jgi:hypothetical protein|uniref:hypothetical protein n=1 Tax=Pseudomonas fluorescens TaxID=294 RepID=UPI0020C23BF8|nr:hypothetical protein [Pseudomonas fluorescens]UTL90838.1 hypothetical protein NLL86_25995 [Pseudomonas fluorescens]